MQEQGKETQGADVQRAVNRRELITGGGLALGALFLAGCGGGRSSAALPKAYWASQPDGATTANIPPAPAMTPSAPAPSVPFDGPGLPPIIPRTAWARLGVARPGEIFEMNGIRRITVHHDGMPPVHLTSTQQVASRIEQIRQAHVMGRGWADLGYHYVIDPSGRVWEGRSTRWQGAHVKDQNENNLGILVMGNFDQQSPTPGALATLDKFLASQMQKYNISMGAVRTHQERAPTACPGRALQGYMVRTRISGGQLYAMASRSGLAHG